MCATRIAYNYANITTGFSSITHHHDSRVFLIPSTLNLPSPLPLLFPTPHRALQIVLAILGLYAGIAGYYQVKGKFTKAAEIRSMPAPAKPDFTTREWSGRKEEGQHDVGSTSFY